MSLSLISLDETACFPLEKFIVADLLKELVLWKLHSEVIITWSSKSTNSDEIIVPSAILGLIIDSGSLDPILNNILTLTSPSAILF